MDNELQHWGIKGMKWGRRRYQNSDGSLTPAGKKRYGVKRGQSGKQETYEERKARVIKSGSAKEVLEFKGDLTPEERRSIQDRLNWERAISGMVPEEVSKGKQYADKIAGIAEDAVGYAKTGIKVWNTAANVINAFSPSEVPLPRIDAEINKDNWESRHKARNEYKKKLEEQEKKEAKERKEREEKEKQKAKEAKEAKEKAKEAKEQSREDKRQEKEDRKAKYSTDGKTWHDAEIHDNDASWYNSKGKRTSSADKGSPFDTNSASSWSNKGETFAADVSSSWTIVPSRESSTYRAGNDWVRRTLGNDTRNEWENSRSKWDGDTRTEWGGRTNRRWE